MKARRAGVASPTPATKNAAASDPANRAAAPEQPDPLITAHLRHLQVDRRLAERTLQTYGEALRRLQRAASAEPVALAAVRPHQVRGWAARLHAQGLGPRSLAIQLAAWRGFYRWLARQGGIAHNPVDGLRPPRPPRPLPKALPVDQAVALAAHDASGAVPDGGAGADPALGHVLACRDHAINELLYGCGLRLSELIALDLRPHPGARGWIDAEAADAHVLGKGQKRRVVPVGGPALTALRAWLAVRAQLADPAEPALFVSRRGTRLSDDQLRRRLAASAAAAGLPSRVHPHMLRHSYASHLLQSSGDLRAVQDLLGHARISTTQIYTRLDFQHLATVYDATHPRAGGARRIRPPDVLPHPAPGLETGSASPPMGDPGPE